MARTPVEGLQSTIRTLLHSHPKGLSIEEITTHLSISRTTTAKYLNAMEQTGQIESRPYGPAKVYTLTERVPIDNLVSLLPHLILVLDESYVIRQLNDALLDFFLLRKGDLVGREIQYSPLGSYMSESRIQVLSQAMDGTPQFLEEDITIGGVTTFFHIRVIPTLFEYGEKGIVLIFEDITALKETQAHLEDLVEARTSELERVNTKLCAENAKYRKVRKELEYKEHQYQQLVESSTDLILKVSAEGELIYHNSLAAQVLGITPSPIPPLFNGTCIPADSAYEGFAESVLSSVLSDASLIKKREIAYQTGGCQIWISWTFRSIPSRDPLRPAVLCVGTDITDRILAERRIIESEHQLSDILSHLPDPTFVINAERQVLFWNQAMEEMTGLSAAYVIGKERSLFTPSIFGYSRPVLADLVFDPDNEGIKQHFQEITLDGGIITAETTGIGRGGEQRIFWVKVTPLKDEGGQICGAIQSMRDITGMRELEQSLIQSGELVRGILDASKDLLVVLDENRRYSFVNAAYEVVFHQSRDHLKGTSIIDNPLPGDPENWARVINSVVHTRLSNRIEVTVTYDTVDLTLDCYLIPFYPGSSEKMYILLAFRDVTRLKGASGSLWGDESALQEIGRQVSRIIPTIQSKNWLATVPLTVFLLACIGNVL